MLRSNLFHTSQHLTRNYICVNWRHRVLINGFISILFISTSDEKNKDVDFPVVLITFRNNRQMNDQVAGQNWWVFLVMYSYRFRQENRSHSMPVDRFLYFAGANKALSVPLSTGGLVVQEICLVPKEGHISITWLVSVMGVIDSGVVDLS